MFYYKIVSNSSNQGPLSIGADWNIAPTNDMSGILFFEFVKVHLMSVVKAMYPLHVMRISCCPMFLKYHVI